MLSVEDARRAIAAHVAVVAVEQLPLLAAIGRVVASPVVAPIALPPFDQALADGWAVRAADLAGAAGMAVMLPAAPAGPDLPAGRAMRIDRGAPLPAGADAVVPAAAAGDARGHVTLPTCVPAGALVRRAGADVARGAPVLEAGQPLNASRVALLAALGRAGVLVYAPLRVALLTIGGDLAEPGGPLGPGQVYDGRTYAVMAAIAEAGGQPERFRAAADAEDVRRALHRAASHDVVVAIGGEAALADALAGLGRVRVPGVAMAPGRSFAFATVRGRPLFGLPGDPAGAAIAFEILVRPALRRMMGHASQERPRVHAVVADDHEGTPGREAYLRARITKAGPTYRVRLLGPQGVASLGDLAAANALVVAGSDGLGFRAGDVVEAVLLEAPELCGMACLPVGLSAPRPSPS